MTDSGIAASIPVLRWAAQRERLHDEDLTQRFPKWPLWLSGDAQPTLRQLENFARLTHTAIGYFFLPEPPELALPVPDFRTVRDQFLAEPSSNLLDTLYLCQQRQAWYRDYARVRGFEPLPFIGSAQPEQPAEKVARAIGATLAVSTAERQAMRTWEDALRQLIRAAEDAGILVMATSVVGSNNHRPLDVDEFRGFVLADDLAPLIFLNGADSKSAQMFTLGHELAHLWLGASGVSDAQAGKVPAQQMERWCNRVAAELLMPMEAVWAAHHAETPVTDEIQRLARVFKVSTLVVLRRLFDAGYINEATLWQQYREEENRLRKLKERKDQSGGDFYRSLGARASKRFSRAVVSSALEGMTSFSEANRLLGVRKAATFNQLAHELGVTA
ncbi:MAG: ImmA/IrrE family metallo-endopeptidase [Rhodanobacter sp.]|nr:MAG: ImmA/IrrE family metallo-endopeptidase [Rhodanobacter sp.]TAL95026.1 MAG: ImmA/IrrE family metallo-endopeptidase [Rhodanobacter sp.]TAM40330.1 MAG: ImmA/IrrE family metallo-endopeptidase [Rhodanobacter sp.]